MKKAIIGLLLIFVVTFATPPQARAQLRKSVATIIFAGLGGAILGLSTLSFYGSPQDHLGNISTGFALGIVAGTVYVTIDSTQAPMATELKPWEIPTNPTQINKSGFRVGLLQYSF